MEQPVVGERKWKQPVGQQLPLTPPATVEKPLRAEKCGQIKPRKLLKQLKTRSRKPRLKYRPEPNTVLNLDDYVSGVRDTKDLKNAEFVRYALQHSRRVIMVTGAGISVAAGIPDFRSSNGLFSQLKGKNCSSGKELFDYNNVYSSDEMNMKFNKMISSLHDLSKRSTPTNFHHMMDEIALEGRLQRLYTQNIDGLDTRLLNLATKVPLEIPAPQTVQLHGSIHHMECNKCSIVADMDTAAFRCQEDDEKAQVVPTCAQCEEFEIVRNAGGLRSQGVGKMRPRVVLYNELHPEGDIIGRITNSDLKKKPDCLIIAGTSLQIPGVKAICKQFSQKVRDSKGIVLYMNQEMPKRPIVDAIGHIDLLVLGDCQNVPKFLSDDYL
ncbi:NAD-dependent histone deacetylase HST4 TDEL_0F05200 [Torulaspora delbrueckii]|uniref:Deacetylase sirtuin-type domain-containing protein n=1 Tax=Torulaspora delbrueckii TaxID=4950 RepID=G8ZXI7_TORDE|nr:hypothetical protein TDEL_0F05200 [Torulaspora delbrueckii]CCE93331.1 hypothetical protein TDEL_0F05200 [Torulaspora delbrueckii]